MNKIGIIGAMEIELETLKSHMLITNTLEKASMNFLEGTLNNTPVVVVKSGSEKSMPVCAYRFWWMFFM